VFAARRLLKQDAVERKTQMPDIEIPMNVEVHSMEGPYGKSRCAILDPIQDKVTHLVVRENAFPQTERLVPIRLVQVSSPQQINLACTREQLAAMESFVEEQFIDAGGPLADSMLWPYVESGPEVITLVHEKIPAGEVKIRRGTAVHATDGQIGRVDELLIEKKTGGITHLILEEGHLWGKKDVSIPVDQIKSIEADGVKLKLSKEEVEALPEVQIHRPRR
jgi:sporulation protein YlmC with PRC-barrel domain